MTNWTTKDDGPHGGQPVLTGGAPLERALAAVVMLHGRGGTADLILKLTSHFSELEFAYIAPQAAGNTWYPRRFLAPVATNEPKLSSALAVVGELLERVHAAGIPPKHTMLLGFSQGACLALEYAARNPQRYGGVIGLSGALIGPPGAHDDFTGDLAGTPVFLGCSDADPHIPLENVHYTAEVMRRLGGDVDERIYPGMGHIISQDELDIVRALMGALITV
jgi:predicted esterase